VDFTPPGVGCSAVGFGFSFSGGGVEGDLVSSGIRRRQTLRRGLHFAKNVNFYQLERVVSTTPLTSFVKIRHDFSSSSQSIVLGDLSRGY
jgi:hypothetical protein